MEESTPACRDDADSFEDSFEDSESEANNSTIRKHYENQSYRKQVRRTNLLELCGYDCKTMLLFLVQ